MTNKSRSRRTKRQERLLTARKTDGQRKTDTVLRQSDTICFGAAFLQPRVIRWCNRRFQKHFCDNRNDASDSRNRPALPKELPDK